MVATDTVSDITVSPPGHRCHIDTYTERATHTNEVLSPDPSARRFIWPAEAPGTQVGHVKPNQIDFSVDLAYGILLFLAIVLILTVGTSIGIAFGLGALVSYIIHVGWKMSRFDPEWMTREVTEKVGESITEEVTESVGEKVSQEVAEDVEEKVAEKVTEDVGERVAEEVSHDVEEKVAEKVTHDVEEKVAEKVTHDVEAALSGEIEDIIEQLEEVNERIEEQPSRDEIEAQVDEVAEEAASKAAKEAKEEDDE